MEPAMTSCKLCLCMNPRLGHPPLLYANLPFPHFTHHCDLPRVEMIQMLRLVSRMEMVVSREDLFLSFSLPSYVYLFYQCPHLTSFICLCHTCNIDISLSPFLLPPPPPPHTPLSLSLSVRLCLIFLSLSLSSLFGSCNYLFFFVFFWQLLLLP